ncbi:hypothetical protein TTHERM_002653430 (macronuclear) [Tetrahymena thermophila SB210]|uniref:Uncharacterized protein n=1 Tax=Tetrahymena thermophila (strain SB210) TaxID=312017 RepID=W7XKU6_TETTS|nr:hypothetical protein TTHERM_002653430 [Tetrahymena thermophila SB210]EWS76806.1 hypothetical protein TTHERM_002653430 [Tetrahymena thermophila SB210]|eukprot:XP_012650659.1 hypothetical protein TTHERM_002653430 [Tetrahymena thermophila SB210]
MFIKYFYAQLKFINSDKTDTKELYLSSNGSNVSEKQAIGISEALAHYKNLISLQLFFQQFLIRLYFFGLITDIQHQITYLFVNAFQILYIKQNNKKFKYIVNQVIEIPLAGYIYTQYQPNFNKFLFKN